MTVTAKSVRHRRRRVAPHPQRGFDFSPWIRLPTSPVATRASVVKSRKRVDLWERRVALLAMIVASPLMLVIALAIKLDSPGGPVLFRQRRVGLDRRDLQGGPGTPDNGSDRRRKQRFGQVFWLFKFRTMIPDAERLTGPVWATENDPRITRVGRILRYLRLDELPQLFNVLRGQMGLIGPRPERPHFVRQLCADIPGYQQRLKVPPGITGLAQVERTYDASLDDVRKKIMYDLFYVQNRCRLLDIKILIKTLDVALRGRGAR